MVSTGDQLAITSADLDVAKLGEPEHTSPLSALLRNRKASVHYVAEDDKVLLDDTLEMAVARRVDVAALPAFEPGGPREQLYFDPSTVRVGIVTCGGLCPGLNNVIRGLVLELAEHYGVRDVVGFRDGYRGLVGNANPIRLSADVVREIHSRGGTMLGTSRGGQDPGAMVDTLHRLGISILFVIGGDGTLRGAEQISAIARQRGIDLAVVGIPKTIDNDIPYIDHSFGFRTAFSTAAESIRAAHTEAHSTPNGIGLVRLMGRHSGFIASYAALASHDVDFVLVPEVPFVLRGADGLLAHLHKRMRRNGHAVIVVAEGAGQELLPDTGTTRDASGNVRLGDIGHFLRDQINAEFRRNDSEVTLRYVDPGYAIRSVPANAYDAVYCLRLAQNAVHAALAGRTSMVVGRWHGRFVHIPISLATGSRNQIDPDGDLWLSVLEMTGQPMRFQ